MTESYRKIRRAVEIVWRERELPGNAGSRFLTDALNGDPEACENLLSRVPSYLRGNLTLDFYRACVAREGFATVLHGVWVHDHKELLRSLHYDRSLLHNMFRYANFPVYNLPEVVEAWRGTSGLSVKEAARGLSWTTNRQKACWFAMRHAHHYGSPLLCRANFRRESVLLQTNDRHESEIVVTCKRTVVIDGDPIQWDI